MEATVPSLPLLASRRRQRSSAPSFPRSRCGLLFCKSQSGSACLDFAGLTHGDARCSTRSHIQSEEVRGGNRVSHLHRFTGFSPQEIPPPTAASIARCRTKLELFFVCVFVCFFPRELNTMWPCRGSDCCPLWEYLTDPREKDFRMGKLQSKHGKNAANASEI